MKKMILLLVLPLTASMAIDFTMTKEGLFNSNTITQSPASAIAGTKTVARSSYEKQITLPKCDANNPEVQFIRSTSDWSHINDANKRIFCVSPGNYIGARLVDMTTSGTSSKPRYIILNNGNDVHPAQLTFSDRANVRLLFNGVGHWIVDRMSIEGFNSWKVWEFKGAASDNIVNRSYFYNVGSEAIYLSSNCNRNTFQNNAFYDMSAYGLEHDAVALNFNGNAYDSIIVNNEFRNNSDALQFTGHNTRYSCEGSVIDNNIFWIDSSLYVDEDGTPDVNGGYALAENAIDLKVGSTNPAKPLIITNNVMWGNRFSYVGESDRSDFGALLSIHYNVQNVEFKDNMLFDAAGGIQAQGLGSEPYAAQDMNINGNTFFDVGENVPQTGYTASVKLVNTQRITVENNDIIEGRYKSIYTSSGTVDTVIANNTLINVQPTNLSGTHSCNSNTVYNATTRGCSSTTALPNYNSTNVVEISIPYDIYSGTTKYKIVKTTLNSPVYQYYQGD